MVSAVSHEELVQKAKRLRWVLSDCDGVLTDAGVWYTAEGELAKRFSLRDGMGVERLRAIGLETSIITREASKPVRERAKKLRLRHHFDGIQNKLDALERVCDQTGARCDALAYIGDDVNDLEIMTEIKRQGGLVACPSDAEPPIQALVHRVLTRPGGHGAFREFAEWIILLRQETGCESES